MRSSQSFIAMSMALTSAAVVLVLTSAGLSHAQWPGVPPPGIPRTADGRIDLAAASPRTIDGKPDLSGV